MSREDGFTLIELIIVMAITSLTFVFVFAGQRDLRSRANFDVDVDQVVSQISNARNQALAGVNTNLISGTTGAGTGTTACPTGTGQGYFAGTAFDTHWASAITPFALLYFEANPSSTGGGPTACSFQQPNQTSDILLPSDDMKVIANSAHVLIQGILFIRDPTGNLVVCSVTNISTQAVPSFRDGACTGGANSLTASGPVEIRLTDSSGHISDISVDASGLAKRLD